MTDLDPADVEAADDNRIVCPVCRRAGRFEAFDTWDEYHEHYREAHL